MTAASVLHLVPHTHWDREWYQPFQLIAAISRSVTAYSPTQRYLPASRIRAATWPALAARSKSLASTSAMPRSTVGQSMTAILGTPVGSVSR